MNLPDEKQQETPPQSSPPQNIPPQDTNSLGSNLQKPTPTSLNWPLGLAIVVIGGLLLARNLGYELFFLDFQNWWAFFIMLAAIGPLQQAFSVYRKEGFSAAVANSLVSAAAIVFIALIFLLDLSFFKWWPVFVIIGGLYMMTNRNR